jgi:hypothetical protein
MELAKMSPLSQARYIKKNRRNIDEKMLTSFLDHSTNFPHIPSKNEAHLLRKLMSQTGLTEAEIRMKPLYRKMLSQSQGKIDFYSSLKNAKERLLRRFFKQVTKQTGLTIEHPKSLALAKNMLKEKSRYTQAFEHKDVSDSHLIHLYHALMR